MRYYRLVLLRVMLTRMRANVVARKVGGIGWRGFDAHYR